SIVFFFILPSLYLFLLFFFFMLTATSDIYTLSLHDALPISYGDLFVVFHVAPSKDGFEREGATVYSRMGIDFATATLGGEISVKDRKSTRLNSSHVSISYAVFCLKKKRYKHIKDIFLTSCKR